jgi:hypothetical protein
MLPQTFAVDVLSNRNTRESKQGTFRFYFTHTYTQEVKSMQSSYLQDSYLPYKLSQSPVMNVQIYPIVESIAATHLSL